MIRYGFILFGLLGTLQAIEPLIVKEKTIHTISSFDSVDYFSTYSPDGEFLWEIPFRTKIESFQEMEGQLFFLSKMRSGDAYVLSCFEEETGKLVWEKPIFSPPVISEGTHLEAVEPS